jgi:DNA-binding CsgD family transcriptional regulator
MASGIGIIKAGLRSSLYSWSEATRIFILGRLLGSNRRLLIRVEDETGKLLAEFADRNEQPVEEAAASWLRLQAAEYRQDREIGQRWAALSDREQKVAALCCLGYADREIAGMLGITYGTARTHLYNAIYKLGITRKTQLHFLLRNWDFSKFDRDWPPSPN